MRGGWGFDRGVVVEGKGVGRKEGGRKEGGSKGWAWREEGGTAGRDV